MDMKEDMMNDAIDDVIGDEEDEEERSVKYNVPAIRSFPPSPTKPSPFPAHPSLICTTYNMRQAWEEGYLNFYLPAYP